MYSRSLKNVQALHGKLDAQAAVFLRFLKSLLYNAFQTSRCLAGYALLNCPSIQDYTTLKNRICAEAEDFSTFLYMIGTETVLADYKHAGIPCSIP